jgi:F-box domain
MQAASLPSLSSLPQQCLEDILAFLPDSAFLTLLLTCKACRATLDGGSLGYWKGVMDRREWPYVVEGEEADRDHVRRTFISHCNAGGIVKAISSAIHALNTDTLTKSVNHQLYQRMKNPPGPRNYRTLFEIWSTNQILVTYSAECILRLCEFNSPSVDDPPEYLEVACMDINPWPPNKLSHHVGSIALDRECIGCVCNPDINGYPGDRDSLVFITRAKLLSSKGDA